MRITSGVTSQFRRTSPRLHHHAKKFQRFLCRYISCMSYGSKSCPTRTADWVKGVQEATKFSRLLRSRRELIRSVTAGDVTADGDRRWKRGLKVAMAVFGEGMPQGRPPGMKLHRPTTILALLVKSWRTEALFPVLCALPKSPEIITHWTSTKMSPFTKVRTLVARIVHAVLSAKSYKIVLDNCGSNVRSVCEMLARRHQFLPFWQTQSFLSHSNENLKSARNHHRSNQNLIDREISRQSSSNVNENNLSNSITRLCRPDGVIESGHYPPGNQSRKSSRRKPLLLLKISCSTIRDLWMLCQSAAAKHCAHQNSTRS